uniref:High mobility group protein B2 n=1 Tax=Esox lucius TaxID=8010 RepID=A0AAY5KGE9_ESOLU
MPGKDPNKPRGKTSSYAFFVQTCREEHKKKKPGTSVNFAEFSKKCSESKWWQLETMSAKEKVKFEDMAKGDKVRYDKEMKGYVPPKGTKGGKRKKDPNAPKRPPSAFFVFCADHRAKIKSENPGIGIGDIAKQLGLLWGKQTPKDKQPYEAKAAKLKEKYEKDIAAYRAKGGASAPAAKKSGPGRPAGGKKAEPMDDDDEDDDEEEDDEEEDEEDDDEDDD